MKNIKTYVNQKKYYMKKTNNELNKYVQINKNKGMNHMLLVKNDQRRMLKFFKQSSYFFEKDNIRTNLKIKACFNSLEICSHMQHHKYALPWLLNIENYPYRVQPWNIE